MKPASVAAAYCGLYPLLAETARSLGYALAIHGSLNSDMDLIAIPWTETATEPQQLITALVEACGGKQPMAGRPGAGGWEEVDLSKPFVKPHGRLVWTILLHGGTYLDVGVMPRSLDLSQSQR